MSNIPRTFRDRHEAGRVLARDLARQLEPNRHNNLQVLGLARGGVPIGWEVAAALHASLDVFLVRKLGVPQWPELAMGAVASGGALVLNENLIRRLEVSDDQIREAIDRETAELNRRELAYRGDRGPLRITGNVLLIDDGIATGASMTIAARSVRQAGAAYIVVGVPVGPASACRELLKDADEVVCTTMPADFRAVGQAFEDFHQVADDEVRALLATPTAGDGAAIEKP